MGDRNYNGNASSDASLFKRNKEDAGLDFVTFGLGNGDGYVNRRTFSLLIEWKLWTESMKV